MVNDLEDAVERDLEVRQARTVAEAARSRLVACLSCQEDGIDLAEAQGMLDVLKNARTLAENAEDRVLLHRGLLTSAEADKRAAKRRPAAARSDKPARPAARRSARVRDLRVRDLRVRDLRVRDLRVRDLRVRDLRASRLRGPVSAAGPSGRRCAARVIASVLVIALGGVAVAILARRGGVRLPPAPR